MKQAVQSTILLLFGVALLKLALSNDLLLYVRPVSRPWVGLAGTALTVLGISSLLGQARHSTEEKPASGVLPDPGDGHGHSQTTPAMWLVLAPMLAVLVIQPPALGVFTANRAPLDAARVTGTPTKLASSAQPVPVSVFQFILLATAKPAVLRTQPVQLRGFILKARPGGFILARLVITCCAADASTAKVDVTYPGTVPAQGSWVELDGRFTSSSGPDAPPRLTASQVGPIEQPANPYDH